MGHSKKKAEFLAELSASLGNKNLREVFVPIQDLWEESFLSSIFGMMLLDEATPSKNRRRMRTKHLIDGISVHNAFVDLMEGPISDILCLHRLHNWLASIIILSCETYVI